MMATAVLIILPGVILIIINTAIYSRLKSGRWSRVQANRMANNEPSTSTTVGEVAVSTLNGNDLMNTLNRNEGRETKHWKAAKTLGILIAIFWLCWTPFLIRSTLIEFEVSFLPLSIFHLAVLFGNLNSALNPLVYSKHNQDFQAAFKLMWRNIMSS